MNSEKIKQSILDSARVIESMCLKADTISTICRCVVDSLKSGGKILTAGNGGSAAEALHMSEELVGRFRGNRISLPAVALVADTTALTCIANDFGYDQVFGRQIEGLARAGDVLVLFSSSGNAKNLEIAARTAAQRGIKTICFLGRDGGRLAGKGDFEIIIDHTQTERIQEAHQVLLHIVLDAVEEEFKN
ncbi:MAG: SIS domain-containing protein [Lentisphaerae bacterium]|nr:SIS domain-containing protein [Lentisphaerota bacterium]